MNLGDYVVWGGVLYTLGHFNMNFATINTIVGGGVKEKEFHLTTFDLRPYYIQKGDKISVKIFYGTVEVITTFRIKEIYRDKTSTPRASYIDLITKESGTVVIRTLDKIYLHHKQD